MSYAITTQKALRKAFWEQNPTVPRRRITNYSGFGKMFPTDTRCAWSDWLDMLSKSGQISQLMKEMASLS